LAKVSRDQQLYELDQLYPEYGFAKHKGYGTKLHLEALAKHGPIHGIHRASFAPIKQLNLF
jgi:ribonuclease HII